MPLNIVFLRPQKLDWSRLKPYEQSTITAVKVLQEQNGERFAISEFWSLNPFLSLLNSRLHRGGLKMLAWHICNIWLRKKN